MEYSLERVENQGHTYIYNLHTSDVSKANLFRTTLMKRIKSYRVLYVTYDINESLFTEEKIAMRIGLSPIIQKELEISDKKRFEFNIQTKDEERWFTTDDIQGLPFFRTHRLSYLQKNSRLIGFVEIAEGTGMEYSSWECTTIPVIEKVGNIYQLIFNTIGMHGAEYIMNEASNMMEIEINSENENIYDKPIYTREVIAEFKNFE